MIRIGEFAQRTGVSVAALRHYAALGLLEPSFVCKESNYRFYEVHQVGELHRILHLKSLGFSLVEIGEMIHYPLTTEEMSRKLEARHRACKARVQIERQKLKQLELQMLIVKGLQKMTINDVITMTVPETTVAAIPLLLPTNEQAEQLLGETFSQLFTALKDQGIEPAGPCMAIWHDTPEDVVDESLEVAVPVSRIAQSAGGFMVVNLPEQQVAAITHTGPFAEFQTCHILLKEWMAIHGYRLSGPYREIYHSPSETQATTEVQYPIEAIS